MTCVGADPGAKSCAGLARLGVKGGTDCKTVSCAADAASWIVVRPADIFVDAPLWWFAGISGDRATDPLPREKYGLAYGIVRASNSLRGAALVQGIIFIEQIRRRFPSAPATKTHPKALMKALELDSVETLLAYFAIPRVS